MAAFLCFTCSSDVQLSAGFDGWVMLVREAFDTEDQAWPQETQRLSDIEAGKLALLAERGVDAQALGLRCTAHLLLEPPEEEPEAERLWCIEYFTSKLYDLVVDDAQLIERLLALQDQVGAGDSAANVLSGVDAVGSPPPVPVQPQRVS